MYGSCMVHVQFMYSSCKVIGTVQSVCCVAVSIERSCEAKRILNIESTFLGK